MVFLVFFKIALILLSGSQVIKDNANINISWMIVTFNSIRNQGTRRGSRGMNP